MFIDLLKGLFLIAVGIGLFFCIIFVDLLLFGSGVDPDDNGLLRTKKQKEKYRQLKLKKMEKYGS